MSAFEWYDGWRVLNLVICGLCIYLLGRRFAKRNPSWNTKTRDYWFALVMWCVAGAAMQIEGLLKDLPLTARLVFVFIASAVTLKGILKSGSWGETNAR